MSTMEKTMNESRHKGQVKFFNSIKGYGFILPEGKEGEETEEVFVHHTAIHNNGGFKSLAEGEQVEYDLVQGPKGMQASYVTGPEGAFVQGDPRTHRQQYSSSGNQGYHRNNNHHHSNRGAGGGVPYNGGYMLDPYSPYGYAVPAGFQFMNIQQPMYGGQYAQPIPAPAPAPPQFHQHHQYGGGGYTQQQSNNNSNNTNNSPNNNNNNTNNSVLSPQLLQQQPSSGGYPTMYPTSLSSANYYDNSPQQQAISSSKKQDDSTTT